MINLYSELEEISFIAGARESLEFEIVYKNGAPVDLSSMDKIYWQLCDLGDKDNPVLEKEGLVFDYNNFRVNLESNETVNLNGKFIHQPVIVDVLGNIYRPAEGLINIVESIKE